MSLSRRRFIGAAGVGAGGIVVGGRAVAVADAGPKVVLPGDPEYTPLTLRGYNRRFVAGPRKIFLPIDAEQVRVAVERSVAEGLRIAVRSGGHCFDGFVDGPHTQAIIDLSRMTSVSFDEHYRAFAVDAGTELGPMYDRLLRGWGVTIPAGICLGVGVGGYLSGGGYGPLSRRLGLAADHVHGVEVVTVDDAGKARVVTATADGPNADLWWAHTGGGGGNFGVVTRFLLRSHDADGADAARLLPKPPAEMLHARLVLPMSTEESFVRFVGNYLAFFERNSHADSPFAGLYAPLHVKPFAGSCDILVLLAADVPEAESRYAEFVAAIGDGVWPPPLVPPLERKSYGDTVSQVYYGKGPLPPRVKVKAAYLRRAYTPRQLRIFYRYLTDPRSFGESQVEFLPFGGAINARPAHAAAMPVRDSFMKMLIHAAWRDPADDEKFLRWARELYREVYAETGGVPVPDEVNGGSYINYPDPDLRDSDWNSSGVPWHSFYYRDNYPRLQRIKSTWDPRGVFQHPLSIEGAAG
ncbi:FAD/FMN-containing dehydrogenase [Nocardia tenerifensis]|uniref:FAD/FMN-containing dehydrogenase n=1 Tax=Nocardia tenerifensis TaxID=228006 RepID=A0A318K142_9NOCA|nr:FAD-binding protein [Nocardia tenerifensis]PXX61066.1 FAD/FMN-containing dehydrogenase [Nocardia tenerifensis]